jgi:hypothetical protein
LDTNSKASNSLELLLLLQNKGFLQMEAEIISKLSKKSGSINFKGL